MAQIVSLTEYRLRRDQAGRGDASPICGLIGAKHDLAIACQELRDVALRLAASASCLERDDPVRHDNDDRDVRTALEKLGQCRADCEEIVRLIDSADVDGCRRFREALHSRANG